MKRNAFALSVAAAIGAFGLAGVATAGVIAGGSFNITGSAVPTAGTPRAVGADALVPGRFKIGHILLGEYFTTQNGNAT
ncbi:MAG: cell surface protein, partial [Ottowia sp.]|nr:cell surface protein [Ottowia sp.]